jgi:hypothetical protein
MMEKLNEAFREALRETCRKAAAEIGAERLRGLSWFYRNLDAEKGYHQ